jgi:hypothetical protein
MTGFGDEAAEEKDKLTAAAATQPIASQQTSFQEDRSADGSVSKEMEHPNDNDGGAGAGEEDSKHRQLRTRLERAVQSEDVAELEPAVEAVKKEKMPNCSKLLDKVQHNIVT